MNKKIIVTGGCGYIGSHVARAFKQNGDTVIVIDRIYRQHTLKGLDGYCIADFASNEALSLIVLSNADVVVHCAGTSLVGPSMTDPGEYYDNNVCKTITMLNAVKDMPKKPAIMFSSSASVYGNPDTYPVTENAVIKPISPYGATKSIAERIFVDYYNAYNLQSMCFRYFNAAGAEPVNFDLGQRWGGTHLMGVALEASINNNAITINGIDYDTKDGTCIRDYIHVWDIARAHVLGASYMLDDYPQPGAHVFNLGTGDGISNKQVVDYIQNKYGIPSIVFGPRRLGDPHAVVADAGLAQEKLNWIPQYSQLSTMLDSAYKWFTTHELSKVI
jgi:UDP-glucose 4-epimerase